MDQRTSIIQKLSDSMNAQNPRGPTSDFDLNPGFVMQSQNSRDAAVLLPIVKSNGRWNLILTKRSSQLKHHPGQIAFPGGKVDATDGSTLNAALREAEEEIGLPQDKVNILGALPDHHTVTSFKVTPYVGIIESDLTLAPEVGEVDEIFYVPLFHILNNENYLVQSRVWNGSERYYFTVPFGPYYIWGATARILRLLCDVVEKNEEN